MSAGFVWDDGRHPLGVAEMDDTLKEFLLLAGQLAAAGDAAFPAAFNALLDHTRAHFSAEDAHMRATRFPAMGEHVSEHQRVLMELRGFLRSVQKGRFIMARAYARDHLADWFALHLATMDAALAAHLKKQATPA